MMHMLRSLIRKTDPFLARMLRYKLNIGLIG